MNGMGEMNLYQNHNKAQQRARYRVHFVNIAFDAYFA